MTCTICHATDGRPTFDPGTGDARCVNHLYTARPPASATPTTDALADS